MGIEYFWVSIIIIFSILIWYFCNYNNTEYFDNFDKIFKTLRDLGFTENDLNNFTKDIKNGKDQDEYLDKIFKIASKKGFSYKEIFEKITE